MGTCTLRVHIRQRENFVPLPEIQLDSVSPSGQEPWSLTHTTRYFQALYNPAACVGPSWLSKSPLGARISRQVTLKERGAYNGITVGLKRKYSFFFEECFFYYSLCHMHGKKITDFKIWKVNLPFQPSCLSKSVHKTCKLRFTCIQERTFLFS